MFSYKKENDKENKNNKRDQQLVIKRWTKFGDYECCLKLLIVAKEIKVFKSYNYDVSEMYENCIKDLKAINCD